MKPLVLYTPSHKVGRRIAARCPGCAHHVRLRGKNADGTDWSKVASAYWPAWAEAIARGWRTTIVTHQRKSDWEICSPVMMGRSNATHYDVLVDSRFRPSGGRSLEKAADLLTTGIQPTRKALPQLVPDGMPPDFHLKAALQVKHPMAYEPVTYASVRYALKYAPEDLDEINKMRGDVAKMLRKLAELCSPENDELIGMCEQ